MKEIEEQDRKKNVVKKQKRKINFLFSIQMYHRLLSIKIYLIYTFFFSFKKLLKFKKNIIIIINKLNELINYVTFIILKKNFDAIVIKIKNLIYSITNKKKKKYLKFKLYINE